jgi:hypothetical protein
MKVFGILLILAGAAFGLYAGLWWAFIGGIVDILNEVRAPELSSINVAIGVAKVVFSGLIGWASGMLLMVPGVALLRG